MTGGQFLIFFKHLSTSLLFFYMCVYKKNTSHISQQPINAVDTGNLSLHKPHALGSGGEQSPLITKGHFRIFASIPRSFAFSVPIWYCEENPSCLTGGGRSLRKHEGFLTGRRGSAQVSSRAAACSEGCRSDLIRELFSLTSFDQICYRNELFTVFEGPEEWLE